ncbi:Tetratricopeptide TPR1 [Plasmopara halstedii]|uniref:Tetratricopeptide TPR1 n=1 Tax=Plasmopara halstedii TaxID=4781 RepID=A0A0P1AXR8_PLAHL|nr:Tetratricopeptide TPR1 [Plasmopara halstedii]CEG46469.1 Tetratricopeptide TPR1 [Plasmopara halstedii]|eukprot:XP_024582838.1 Tetratricopeptide TPR1 [Plasmopara halstedii]
MDFRVLINYYLRKGWYDHVQRFCEQILERNGNDPAILFWRAFGIVLERSYSSGIRELGNLKQTGRGVELPCLYALIYAHTQCKHVDHDEVAQLELQLVIVEENASIESLILCATFFWHLGERGKARKFLDRVLRADRPNSSDNALCQRALILRGWVDLTVDPIFERESDLRDGSIRYFDLVTDRKDAELVLGIAKYYDLKKAYPRALEHIDELIVEFPWFKHSLCEKALVLLKMGNWDQCMDSVERALSENPHDIEALRIMILLLLSREGRTREGAERIRELLDALKRTEPANPDLFFEISRSIAHVSDRDVEVLQCSLDLMEHAIQLRPESGAFRAERGYQRGILCDFAEAMESYKEALKLDESNEMALHGMIYCQIKLGQLEDASQQMEFLSLIQESIGASASFTFLQALLSWEKDRDRVKQVNYLRQSMKIHMDKLNTTIKGPDVSSHDMMVLLDPIFLVEVAMEFFRDDKQEKGNLNDNLSDAASEGINILEKVVSKSPGFLRTQFVLSQAYFDAQRLDDAYQVSSKILKMEPGHSKAHLMHARVSLERGHFRAASASLDRALSYDFSVRQSLSYYIIRARILEHAGNVRDALQTLQTAMKMIQNNGSSSSLNRQPKHVAESTSTISPFDKASLYINMAQVLSQLNDLPGATKTVREALDVFRGTAQEVRVLVANSELAVKRGDYDAAIGMLSSVPKDSPAFTKAQTVKADIFLQYRKDKHLYVRCYQELVAQNPCQATHISLAEAYLHIQMLDEAVQSFERAKALSPSDPTIAGRIGRVLISKHDYLKAVDYYESALKMAPENLVLRKDLAELYIKLRHFEQALFVVQQAATSDSEALSYLLPFVDLQLVLPKIYCGLGSDDMAVQALMRAYAIQKIVLDRQKDEQPDVLNKQRAAIAETCFQIAAIYSNASSNSESNNVIKYCTLALQSDESHEDSLLYMARAYQQIGDLGQCQMRCLTLLRLNPAHEEAALMLADLLLQKEDNEAAIYHFQQLLDSRPNNFAALSRLLVMLRRAGKLHTSSTDKEQGRVAQRYLSLAERSANAHVAHAPGLHFCKGLYARFRNNVLEAIDEFNRARRDPEWGERALINMIEIYLNPDNESLWDSGHDGTEDNTKEQADNLRIANTLLDELPIARSERDAKLRVLEAYAVLAGRTKSMLDKSIQLFVEILETVDRDYVPALLGLATGYMLTKQQPKARNQLKRIAKMPYDQTLADEFERSYLLLADIYINRGKFDLAQELCKRSLTHNKSSGKAWELLGLVMEKEQSFIDAAECYQEAWTCEGEASAAIGFKLAFNYLKAKKLVLAVNICNKVLDQYPDYPKIRKDILEKAYAGFRP